MAEKRNISSLSLFHFTNSLQTLERILTSRHFIVSYCEERHWGGYKFSIPMACFCDIPLSQIAAHINRYGCYGIGLNDKWDNSKKLSSVIYSRPESELSRWVTKTLKNIACGKINAISDEAIYLLSRIKKNYGKFAHNKKNKAEKEELVCFYNEREWRYVPKNLKIEDIKVGKENEDFELPQKEEFLTFDFSDIKYIIIGSECEREKIIKHINKIKTEEKERDLLKSRIISTAQIMQDF